MAKVVRNAVVVLAGVAVLLAACGTSDRPRPSGSDSTEDTTPMVGGACTYETVTFRAVVDSVLPGPRLLVQELDSVAANAALCRSVGEGSVARWLVPAPASGRAVGRGDTLEVTGQVIVTGTCSPCALQSRHLGGR